jgi:hypothetical protein
MHPLTWLTVLAALTFGGFLVFGLKEIVELWIEALEVREDEPGATQAARARSGRVAKRDMRPTHRLGA